MTLGIIDRPQLGCSLTMFVVAFKDASGTLTLASDYSTHDTVLFKYNYKEMSIIISATTQFKRGIESPSGDNNEQLAYAVQFC